jgi:hypothetical protein
VGHSATEQNMPDYKGVESREEVVADYTAVRPRSYRPPRPPLAPPSWLRGPPRPPDRHALALPHHSIRPSSLSLIPFVSTVITDTSQDIPFFSTDAVVMTDNAETRRHVVRFSRVAAECS